MRERDDHVTHGEFNAELKSFRNEVRLLVFGAVFANQLLRHTSFNDVVSTAAAGVPLLAAVALAAWHHWSALR